MLIPSTITHGKPADIRPPCISVATSMGRVRPLWMSVGGPIYYRRFIDDHQSSAYSVHLSSAVFK